jgi:hypothetical protein
MPDDTTGTAEAPETPVSPMGMPDADIDAMNKAIAKGTESTEGANDPFLDDGEEEEDAQQTASAMEQVLSGVKSPEAREKALCLTDRYYARYMKNCAKRRLEASMEDSGRLSDLRAFWEELTPEARAEYVEGHGELFELVMSLIKSGSGLAGATLDLGRRCFLRVVTSIAPRALSSLNFFSRKEVLELVALGVLPCDEASAEKASEHAGEAKFAAKLLKYGAILEPELKVGVPVAEGAAHVRSHYDMLISKEVRPAIMEMRKSMEAEKTMEEAEVAHTANTEHDNVLSAERPAIEGMHAQAVEPTHEAAASKILAEKARKAAEHAAAKQGEQGVA